jgi:hypothetical protein
MLQVLGRSRSHRGVAFVEVALEQVTLLKGVLDWALVIGERLLEHLVDDAETPGGTGISMVYSSDKISLEDSVLLLQCLLLFVLGVALGRLFGRPPAASLALVLMEMASTASCPEANLLVMSINSLALVGVLQPNLLTRSQ